MYVIRVTLIYSKISFGGGLFTCEKSKIRCTKIKKKLTLPVKHRN